MFRKLWAALVLALFLLPTTMLAQRRVDIGLQGGVALPTQDVGGVDLNTGFGFEGTVSYRFLPHLAFYGGWDWHRFTTDEALATVPDIEETGYAFGLRFEHPMGALGAPAVVLRAGGVYNHIEVENEAGTIVEDTGHGLGWEVGAGVAFGVGDRWRAVPGVRFRSLTRDMTMSGVTASGDLTYVAFELGLFFSI